MTTDELKAIARRDLEGLWFKGDLTLADELYAPGVVDHHPLPGQAPGREGVKQAVAMVSRSFPGQGEIHGLVAEGDTVTRWWTLRGTHEGEFLGLPATHKPFTLTGIDVLRIAEGKIVEFWHQEDLLGLMMQLGAVPPPAGSPS
jgi:predicted ester cyclase